MRSATPNPDKILVTSVRIPAALMDRFKLVAESENRSVSQHMRHLMKAAVEAYEAGDVAA